MSANHTLMDSSTFMETVDQYIAVTRASRAFEATKTDMLDAQRVFEKQNRELMKRLGDIRNRNVKAIVEASEQVQQVLTTARNNAEAAQTEMAALDSAVQQAFQNVSQLNAEVRAAANTAMLFYEEVSRQIAMSQTEPDYQKFASADLASFSRQLLQFDLSKIGSQASQMVLTRLMNDVLLMDVKVAKLRHQYQLIYTEAVGLSASILEHISHNRQHNFVDPEDNSSPLIDPDFWSNGRYELVRKRVAELRDHILQQRDSSSYRTEQLRADLEELQRLDKMEQQLLLEARQTFNHSENRRAQGRLCRDILVEDMHYQVVGEGFDLTDAREAYVVRLKRSMSGAQIEIIVNQGDKEGEYDIYFRVDTLTYVDTETMNTIYNTVQHEFEAQGVKIRLDRQCTDETLEDFNSQRIQIDSQARLRHGIKRQPHPNTI